MIGIVIVVVSISSCGRCEIYVIIGVNCGEGQNKITESFYICINSHYMNHIRFFLRFDI